MSVDVITEDIVCDGGLPAFVARPQGAGPFPVYVLMHERYGLVRHTKDLAIRCARDGLVAIAPNYFYRHPDQAGMRAGTERYDLTDPESVTYNRAVLQAIGRIPGADGSRVAVGGYCQTGRHPLVFAAETPIAAAVVWYGAASKREWEVTAAQPEALDDVIGRFDCPVFGAFGETDHIISVEDVRRFRNSLERHGKSYDIHLYPGAPHGWLNDTMPGRYRREQAEAAWGHQQAFLWDVFGGQYPTTHVRWRFASETAAHYDFSKNVRLE